jgi:hypothetical protein
MQHASLSVCLSSARNIYSCFVSGTIKLNISRMCARSHLLDGTCCDWAIDTCVHEAEEELRLGEIVLKSCDSSIPSKASEALTSIIVKMVSAAAAAGYRLSDPCQSDRDSIATVAAATAVYRCVRCR